MEVIKYNNFKDIFNKSKELNIELFETHVSISFRIFENNYTKELHIFYY